MLALMTDVNDFVEILTRVLILYLRVQRPDDEVCYGFCVLGSMTTRVVFFT